MKLVLKENLSTPPKKGYVRIKILKFVGQFSPGDIVDCNEENAKYLIMPVKIGASHENTEQHLKAVLLSECVEIDLKNIDLKKITQSELAELGLKNIVETPKDKDYDAKLAAFGKMPTHNDPIPENYLGPEMAKVNLQPNYDTTTPVVEEPDWVKNGKPVKADDKRKN